MDKNTYSIIDIGSNTIRLVIYSSDKSSRLKEIQNVKAVARLRNHLTSEGILAPKGIDILINTLLSFQEVTRYHQIKGVKCVATATIRQAKNQQEIIDRVKQETDFSIRVLSEYEEAFYGYLAVVNSTPFNRGITIDIGGGSTELTYFENRKLIHYHSFPFGALSLKEQFVMRELPTEEEKALLKAYLTEQFKKLDWIIEKQLPIIGIGGSARNMVQIHQEYIGYPLAGVHLYMMNKQNIKELSINLSSMPFTELQKVEGLSKDRADIIVPAIEVFDCLMDIVNTDKFVLSRKGLRDGIFYEEHTKGFGFSFYPNVIEEGFSELALDYNINKDHAVKVMNNAVAIAQLINRAGLASINKDELELIKKGAFVNNIGSYIDSVSSSQHTFYLLANRTIDGLLHKERITIALLASYKNKDTFKRYITPYIDWFKKDEISKLRLLGSIIKFSTSLNITKRDIVDNIKLVINSNQEMTFYIICTKNWKPEQYQIEKQKKHLEKQIKKSITVHFLAK